MLSRISFVLAVLLSAPSVAQDCFIAAGQRYGIHPWLLYAIAEVESSANPAAVNRGHVTQTRSVDIGVMQINSRWVGKLGVEPPQLMEPCYNIHVGAWILADLFTRHGHTWEAVGAYNASCRKLKGADCQRRRAWYATKVARAYRRIVERSGGEG